MKFTIYPYQQRIEINLLLFLKQYTVTIERNSLSLVRKLMRKNKLGVSRCDKELRRDFNAFPVVHITKEGEKYRSKGKSLASNECVLAVFLFEKLFLGKICRGNFFKYSSFRTGQVVHAWSFSGIRDKKVNRSEQLLLPHKRNEGPTRDFDAISWKPLRNRTHFSEVRSLTRSVSFQEYF